ncbi:MAG: DUF4292 domain-containing protein [Bacteroidales bacterium]|jgi:hypothetical protein|nr:DUF4292 domain-containing protein [Bacteroidales bacterium]
MMVRGKKILWVTVVFVAFSTFGGCRSGRNAAKTEDIISENAVTSCYSPSSIAVNKCKWNISQEGKSYQLNGNLYIRPDSICFFRGVMLVEVFRGVVKRDSFAVISHLERVCYRGSNNYLSRMCGYPVNPQSLYLLFTANRCEQAYREMGFGVTASNRKILLSNQPNSLELYLDENTQRIEKITVIGQAAGSGISYRNYQQWSDWVLPSTIDISFRMKSSDFTISAVLQDFLFNTPHPVNFKIPTGYKTVTLR